MHHGDKRHLCATVDSMKIVLATPLYPPEIGGPATYTKELAERLRDNHEVTIVAFATTSEKIPGTKLITISKQRPLPIRLAKFTWELFKAARYADIIYVQNAVAAGLPAALVHMVTRVPVVLKFVGDESWERATQLKQTGKRLEEFLEHPEGSYKIRLIGSLQGWVLRRVSVVTTPSVYLTEAIVKTYRVPRSHAVVNYNAAEKTDAPPFDAAPRRHQIAATARLTEWKGVDGILRAVAILKDSYPDVRLVVAGDGPQENELKELAHTLGIDAHVDFRGRVSRAETWHIRKSSEVYVLNSTYEGLPHTALTSFAAEIPMVATDIPGTNEAVYHEKTGLLVAPGDDAALAQAIARIFEDSELGQRLVSGGTKILTEKFSWDSHIKNLLDIFGRITSHH